MVPNFLKSGVPRDMAGIVDVEPDQNTMEQEKDNWLKVVDGLFILRDAIAPIIEHVVEGKVEEFRKTPLEAVCGICTNVNIAYDKKANCHWTIKDCKQCDSWLKKIAEQHNYNSDKKKPWENTDVACWSTKSWEVGKCYLPVGHTKDENSASDSDCHGLLKMIKICKFVQEFFDKGVTDNPEKVKKVSEIRNGIFHAKARILDQSTTDKYFDTFIDYVESMNMMQVPEAVKVIVYEEKLKQLRDKPLYLPGERKKIECAAINIRLEVLYANRKNNPAEEVKIALEETLRYIKQNRELMVFFKDKFERMENKLAELVDVVEGVVEKMGDLSSQQNLTQNQLEGVVEKMGDLSSQQNLTQSVVEEMKDEKQWTEQKLHAHLHKELLKQMKEKEEESSLSNHRKANK